MCASTIREGSRPSGHLDILSGARYVRTQGLHFNTSTRREYGWFYSQFYKFTLGTSLGFVWDGLCHVALEFLHSFKSPSRGEFSTKGQERVRTRSVKVQKAQLSFIFIWLAADLSILFSSLKIAPKITRQKLMSDNPTSSEEKKLCKSLFSKYLVGRLLTFPHFSQLTLSYQSQEKTISKATFPEDFTWYRSVSKRK